MITDKKEGIELILDLAAALQARIAQAKTTALAQAKITVPHCLGDLLGHWEQLVKNILVEATKMRLTAQFQPLQTTYAALDRIAALMALPGDTPAPKIAEAVQIALKRLQDLEARTFDQPTVRVASTIGARIVGERLVSDEPSPSYVMERLEGLVLGGWLGDAVTNLERVAEYMRANEDRMSEPVFDELRRVADKLERWSNSILHGNMFPEE